MLALFCPSFISLCNGVVGHGATLIGFFFFFSKTKKKKKITKKGMTVRIGGGFGGVVVNLRFSYPKLVGRNGMRDM